MFVETSQHSDIISYRPSDNINKISGFYFNQDTGWYEIWWATEVSTCDDDTQLLAKVRNVDYIDVTLMEALSYWSDKSNHMLDLIVRH